MASVEKRDSRTQGDKGRSAPRLQITLELQHAVFKMVMKSNIQSLTNQDAVLPSLQQSMAVAAWKLKTGFPIHVLTHMYSSSSQNRDCRELVLFQIFQVSLFMFWGDCLTSLFEFSFKDCTVYICSSVFPLAHSWVEFCLEAPVPATISLYSISET